MDSGVRRTGPGLCLLGDILGDTVAESGQNPDLWGKWLGWQEACPEVGQSSDMYHLFLVFPPAVNGMHKEVTQGV